MLVDLCRDGTSRRGALWDWINLALGVHNLLILYLSSIRCVDFIRCLYELAPDDEVDVPVLTRAHACPLATGTTVRCDHARR